MSLQSRAADLKPETLNAWNDYVRAADQHMQARAEGEKPFLWIDESPERRTKVRAGEILVARANGAGARKVPHGLIHDWIGAAFFPNATIDDVFGVVRDYDDYQAVYGPAVASIHLLAASPHEDRFRMVWLHKALFVTAVVDSDYDSKYVRLDGKRWYSSASSTRVQEIRNYGAPDEVTLPRDRGDGFLWRLHSITRYEERDGGVYVEVEAIGLTRDIPFSLEWVVKPIAERLAKDSITKSLGDTREAVAQKSLAASNR